MITESEDLVKTTVVIQQGSYRVNVISDKCEIFDF